MSLTRLILKDGIMTDSTLDSLIRYTEIAIKNFGPGAFPESVSYYEDVLTALLQLREVLALEDKEKWSKWVREVPDEDLKEYQSRGVWKSLRGIFKKS